MKRILRFPIQTLIAVATLLALAIPTVPASAQTTSATTPAQPGSTANTIQIMIDGPAAGSLIRNGTRIIVGGWAVDPAGPGVGIDMVRVYLDGQMEAGGTLLGAATTGGQRPDVAAALGNPAFRDSGFDFFWTPTNLAGGNHTLYVYAHSVTSNSWAYKSVTVNIEGAPSGQTGGPGQGPGQGYGPGQGQGYDQMMGQGRRMHRPPPPPPPPPPPLLPPPFPPQAPGGLLPGPASVTPAAVTGTTVTLTWTPSPGAVSYRVLQGTAGGAFVPANVSNITQSSATVVGLIPMTMYQFQVVPVDAFGMTGQPSPTVTVTTTPGP
jgi:hypothetical protein